MATISGQTPVHHPKLHPPKQPIEPQLQTLVAIITRRVPRFTQSVPRACTVGRPPSSWPRGPVTAVQEESKRQIRTRGFIKGQYFCRSRTAGSELPASGGELATNCQQNSNNVRDSGSLSLMLVNPGPDPVGPLFRGKGELCAHGVASKRSVLINCDLGHRQLAKFCAFPAHRTTIVVQSYRSRGQGHRGIEVGTERSQCSPWGNWGERGW